MDDLSEEAQDAAGALKPVERAPVVVQPPEQLRVDGIRPLHALAVIRLVALRGKVVLIAAVHPEELVDSGVAVRNGVAIDRLEEPAADDLEALVPRRGTPRLADALKDVF